MMSYFNINIKQGSCVNMTLFNERYSQEKTVLLSSGMAGWLLLTFFMFTQPIKLYTFHYQYRCLKDVIHQIDSKNEWLLL